MATRKGISLAALLHFYAGIINDLIDMLHAPIPRVFQKEMLGNRKLEIGPELIPVFTFMLHPEDETYEVCFLN